MSIVVKETGYRALSHVVQTEDGKQYMVSSNDTFDHGFETMVFEWNQKNNEVDNWLEVYADWYTTYDEMEASHKRICENLEKYLEEQQ